MLKRDLIPFIEKAAKHFPVIAILGPRQSGKTTLSQMIFTKHRYLTLEDPDIRLAAKQDPRTFLIANKNNDGTIIDEFQYVPELLSYIQTIVDKEQVMGYFVLTGSQNFLMNEAITQSLAGRVSIHTLLPLSQHELSENNALPAEIEPALYKGSYPAIYAKDTPPDLLYKNYLQTYIERDVRQLTQVGDLNTFQTFITLCATRIGQVVNLTSLGNDCGISDATAKRWLSILQASYIIFLLQPYYKNFGKRLIKSPKIYFYDTGLICHLLKIKEHDLALHPNRGNIFESYVISEIIKWHYNRDQIPSIHFWRDKTDHEVDCIIEKANNLIPIEIKASRTASQHFFSGINYFNELSENKAPGYVVYAGSEEQPKINPQLVSWQSIDKMLSIP